jgi:hypothetical protein
MSLRKYNPSVHTKLENSISHSKFPFFYKQTPSSILPIKNQSKTKSVKKKANIEKIPPIIPNTNLYFKS